MGLFVDDSCPHGLAPMRRGDRHATGIPPARERAMGTHAYTTSSIVRVLIGLAVLWGLIGLSGAGGWARDTEYTRATLRGLEGVWVVVEGLGPDVEQAGLTKQQLQTDVELWLRKAGIPVLTEKVVLEVPGAPWSS